MSSQPKYAYHRPHPWHGLTPGKDLPGHICVFVEMTPLDDVKYELDKQTGFLCIDRPQRTTSNLPYVYGFMPQTYCAENVARLSPLSKHGDHDPLDVCVISERPINRSEIVLNAKVVGGLQMVDGGEADDKIIAILEGDHTIGDIEDLAELPSIIAERLQHYFSTYKIAPGVEHEVDGLETYGRDHAFEVINAAMDDYKRHFGAHAVL